MPYKFLTHVIKSSSEGYYQLIVGVFPKLMKRLVSDVRLNISPVTICSINTDDESDGIPRRAAKHSATAAAVVKTASLGC